jgi:glutathione reductase (NADPH)
MQRHVSIRNFDVVVIGTGSAASTVALHCREAGWGVAIVDSRPFGGTCALRGCDPKKVLLAAAEALDFSLRMQGKGIKSEAIQIDWPELMRFKRSFTESVPKRREDDFARAGISCFHGRARFIGPTSIVVGEEQLKGRKVVIAAGEAPVALKIPGAENLITSDQFLELDELPRRILFIGGGYIAFEFAHLASLAGSRVAVVHRGARPLDNFDPDLVKQLVERTRQLGVDLRLETEAVGVEKTSAEMIVTASRAGVTSHLSTDLVVHAAGRAPELDDLDLEEAGIEWDEQGVRVNEFLQSVSNADVYAAGDAAASGSPRLSPVASYEGRLVAGNLLKGNHESANYLGIPSVVFTVPFSRQVGGHLTPLSLPARCRNILRLQNASGRRHRSNSGRAYLWKTGRRSHQSLCRCHSHRHTGDGIKAHSLCISHWRLDCNAHA